MAEGDTLEVMGYQINPKNITNPALRRVIIERANRKEFMFFGAKNDCGVNSHHTEHQDHSDRSYSDYSVYSDHKDYSARYDDCWKYSGDGP